MKKLLMVSLVLFIALGLVFAGAYAGIKEKKAVRISNNAENQTVSQPVSQKQQSEVVKVTAAPADGVELGTTDYEYGWNSGARRNIVVNDAGTKVHMQWMERNSALTAPENRRAIVYSYYDWGTSSLVKALPVPRATKQTGFGAVDAFWGGEADNIAAIVGHSSVFFAIDGGPGAGNFTFTNLTDVGPNDPSLTIDQANAGTIYYNDSYSANRDNIRIKKSADYGSSWDYPAPGDTNIITENGYIMGNIDNKILIAPNGNLAIVTCLLGKGAIAPVGTANPDSADCIGYFTSTNQGATWVWTTLGRDGEQIVIGTDTVYNYFENFGSLDAVYDHNNNLHVAVEMYAIKVINDSTSSNYFGTLYWKTGQTGWKLISRPEDMHVADFDSTYYAYSGNAIGHPYPAITVDPNGDGVFAIWSQSRITGGQIDLSWDGIMNYDLWYTYSNNAGATWTTAQKLPNSSGGLFVSTAPILTKPNSSTYRAHLVYIADTTAGCNVFGEGGTNRVPVVYRTVDYTSTVGVSENGIMPAKFALDQNYPNPFNPSTDIRYQLGSASNVTLKVYNVVGQEVATLINEHQIAGEHTVKFKSSNLSSGVYFYKLQAGTFNDVKKMILMK